MVGGEPLTPVQDDQDCTMSVSFTRGGTPSTSVQDDVRGVMYFSPEVYRGHLAAGRTRRVWVRGHARDVYVDDTGASWFMVVSPDTTAGGLNGAPSPKGPNRQERRAAASRVRQGAP